MFKVFTPVYVYSFAALLAATTAHGQDEGVQAEDAKEADKPVVTIQDEPINVDPASLMPDLLAKKATTTFENSSLREVVSWLRDEQKIAVLIDSGTLSRAGISLGEPVSDVLQDAPLYLLLNRLRALGLSWYVDDDILHITTLEAANERMSTKPYNVGDLLDKGYGSEDIVDAVSGSTGGLWQDLDGEGGATEMLGDVLFVRQTDAQHLEVRGLLTALRKHGRRTLTLDPTIHQSLRAKLDENVNADFNDTPLESAVQQLATQVKADMRLDVPALREVRIRNREPVTLKLENRSLKTVLQVLLADLELTHILRDGVLWITSVDRADSLHKTAVYDVRDLCRNDDESSALVDALLNQTAGPWLDIDGDGGSILFPQPGTMIVRQTEQGLDEILSLLQTYRTAILASKPRDRDKDARQEVSTRYYQVHSAIADDLVKHLPQLVEPDSWQNDANQKATGTILRIRSTPEKMDTILVERSVLVIRQTMAVHEQISELITRVEQGDPDLSQGGFGGGGFGGGLFSVPNKPRR